MARPWGAVSGHVENSRALAIQRFAISASRQRFTFAVTRRTVPSAFSLMFVYAKSGSS